MKGARPTRDLIRVLGPPSRRYTAGLAVVAAVLAGFTCHKNPTEPGGGQISERWYQRQTDGRPHARPAASDSFVYFAAGNGSVVSRHISTGVLKWSTRAGTSEYASSSEIGGENLVLSAGIVVVPVAFHTSGLDARTGVEIWRYHAPLDTVNKVSHRPGYVEFARIASDESTVYIPAWGATVSAVDSKSGQAKWIWRVEATVPHRSGSFGVRLSGDTVFASVWHFLDPSGTKSEAWLVALDKRTGHEFWRVVLPRQLSGTMASSAPAVWRNLVFVTTIGDLYAVDRTTRQIAWSIPTQIPPGGLPTAVITGPEVFADVVYVNGSDQKIHAYRALDGTRVWESADVGQLYSDMLVTEKFVYAVNGPELVILDRNNGTRYAALRHPRKSTDYTFSSPVAAHKGQIFATLSDGAWSFDEP